MKQLALEHPGPLVLLHGGAGPMDPSRAENTEATKTLITIGEQGLKLLREGQAPLSVACFCCEQMESDPRFNAGTGSALQADGLPRLSAALMDGNAQRFSGVINVSHLAHPTRLCVELQRRRSRVLTGPGAELLARELGLPVHSNLTQRRVERWVDALTREQFSPEGKTNQTQSGDTVGCAVRGSDGALVAAASTGGRGFEFPGRVSDTCSVAGTYASLHAAVLATGVGEQIIDDALAIRLETRVRDGMALSEASKRCFEEAQKRAHAYGWVALTTTEVCAAHTTRSMPFAAVGLEETASRVIISSA